ncbi:MAG: sulfatase-like hydrolase/transferase [Sedimentisphaerales bacterium]|nr:sulfatase-like hydrolase/transferase [Sedimentisphaerales bacterium]
MNRRDFLKSVSLVGVTAAIAGCAEGEKRIRGRERRPNILMILVDDLGYGDLSCYGAQDMRTPHLDALMASGMRFDSFYANCPVCSPSRAALLTGRYPDMVGVPGVIRTHQSDSWGYLKEDVILLPQLLKKAGYHTAVVGKWHLGLESPNVPNERGFDHFHGFLGDMMDDYWNHRRHDINYMYLNKKKIEPEGHATDLFTQWSVDYITSRKDSKKPFFLYLAYNAPHTPIHPPAEWVETVKQRQAGITDKRAKLVALIEHLDDGIGKVIQLLKDTGQWGNTLVIFTSDNGGQTGVGANNGPLRGGKQDMWEGGIREPFCAVWPGHIPTGIRKVDTVACTMDLYPTMCEAAGVPIVHEIDGRSFLPTLLGQTQSLPDRYLVWMRREGNPRYGGRIYYAIRYDNWKLLQNSPFEPMQLFDLKNDPKEENPLSNSHPMFKRLFMELSRHINQAGGIPWAKEPADVDKVYQGI